MKREDLFSIGVMTLVTAILIPALVTAQSVAISDTEVTFHRSDGALEAHWEGDDLYLGGGGFDGDLHLARAASGDATVIHLDASDGDADFGGGGIDGDIYLRNASGLVSIQLDGASGNVTQSLTANGLVKAWARINADGTIASCWNCNEDTMETQKLDGFDGWYEVDFTPLAEDITSRPVACTGGHLGNDVPTTPTITCTIRNGDPSSINVYRTISSSGSFIDMDFTIIIF